MRVPSVRDPGPEAAPHRRTRHGGSNCRDRPHAARDAHTLTMHRSHSFGEGPAARCLPQRRSVHQAPHPLGSASADRRRDRPCAVSAGAADRPGTAGLSWNECLELQPTPPSPGPLMAGTPALALDTHPAGRGCAGRRPSRHVHQPAAAAWRTPLGWQQLTHFTHITVSLQMAAAAVTTPGRCGTGVVAARRLAARSSN